MLRDISADDAARLAGRLITGVEQQPVASEAHRVGVSVGIASLRRGESATDWYVRADTALYAAKRSGGGRVQRAP